MEVSGVADALPEPKERHGRAVGWREVMASVKGDGDGQSKERWGELSPSPHDPNLGLTQTQGHIPALLYTTS